MKKVIIIISGVVILATFSLGGYFLLFAKKDAFKKEITLESPSYFEDEIKVDKNDLERKEIKGLDTKREEDLKNEKEENLEDKDKEDTEGMVDNMDNIDSENISGNNENHPNSLLNLMSKEFDGSNFEVGEELSENSLYTRYFISYQSEGLTISGIMNVPSGDGPFPVLILNHGYIDPAVYTNGRGLKREQDYFSKNGYVVVHPDYRGHAKSSPDPETGDEKGMAYSGYTTDVINAIVSLQKSEIPYIDMGRVGMLGHSMGGGITMNVLVSRPELVKAAVLYAPVSSNYQKSFLRWRKEILNKAQLKSIEDKIGDINNSDNFAAFSSATYFGKIESPIMLHQGTEDKDIPLDWSHETRDKLEKAGKEITYFEYPGEPHEFVAAWQKVMQRSLDFFNDNLKEK